MEGETLTVKRAGGKVMLVVDAKGGTSTVTIASVNQSNGVIHVVNTVRDAGRADPRAIPEGFDIVSRRCRSRLFRRAATARGTMWCMSRCGCGRRDDPVASPASVLTKASGRRRHRQYLKPSPAAIRSSGIGDESITRAHCLCAGGTRRRCGTIPKDIARRIFPAIKPRKRP